MAVVPKFFQTFIRPFCIAALSVLFGRFFVFSYLRTVFPEAISTVASIASVALMYLLLLLICRAIRGSDVLLLPGGKKIHRILQKKKLISED